jgi:hypothetical protein
MVIITYFTAVDRLLSWHNNIFSPFGERVLSFCRMHHSTNRPLTSVTIESVLVKLS